MRILPNVALAALVVAASSGAGADAEPHAAVRSALAAYADDKHDDLHAVAVSLDNERIATRYYNDSGPSTLVDVRSAGKSVTSLVLGIALERGIIRSLDDNVAAYWPEASDTDVGTVRLADLATMRSGLDADANIPESVGNEDHMDASDDPLTFSLSVPLIDPPGKHYRYNSLAAYLVGVTIDRASDSGFEAFAARHLFEPLGITQWDWMEDRSGQTKGQGNLFLTADGFTRLGELVLGEGEFDGRRVVSRKWIAQSTSAIVDVSEIEPGTNGYGYYWYSTRIETGRGEQRLIYASGNGGNKIYVIPESRLVVTVLSSAYGQGRGHRRSAAILKDVLEALAAQ